MKKINMPAGWKAWTCFLCLNIIALLCFSQTAGENSSGGSTSTSHTSVTTTTWYTYPWVWVVGAIVLLLVIISLLRGKNTTRETTIIKD
jgi:hypothetical protein